MVDDPLAYPFRLPNYQHQQKEFDENRNKAYRGLLWQMRSGKTKAIIDLACYSADLKRIDGVLIIAPNGVHLNWIFRELKKHHWNTVPYKAAVWVASDKTKDHWKQSFKQVCENTEGLSWLAVNCDAFQNAPGKKTLATFLRKRKNLLVVFDESHEFGAPGSKRSKAARALARKTKMRRILSGTPVDESPLKAYSQFELLEPEALGFNRYSDFKRQYCVEEEGYNQKTKTRFMRVSEYINQDELRAKIAAYSSVVLREDCDDMPDLVPGSTMFQLTDRQKEVSKELIDGMMQRLESGEVIKPVDGGALIIRLQQIRSGYAVDEDGVIHSLVLDSKNPALLALGEVLDNSSGKMIIWCRFREEIRLVSKMLKARKVKAVEYHGGVKTSDRHKAIDMFQDNKAVTVFIGQPQAGGQGLDLSAADYVTWFSHTFSAIQRNQANERATQIGGKRIGLTDIVGQNTPDDKILVSLADKAVRADFLAGSGLKNFLNTLLVP